MQSGPSLCWPLDGRVEGMTYDNARSLMGVEALFRNRTTSPP
jgi:hypothetical protein